MAEIKAFKGYRFKLDKKEELGKVIAPPYDMIDDPMLNDLYNKDGHNTARVDCNRKESTDKENRDRHKRAKIIWEQWIANGVVVQDSNPSIYVYEQRFEIDSRGVKVQRERTGIVVLVKLVDFSEGIVQPHEHTLSGPKQDRYEHLDELKTNMGQLFGLVPDKGDLYDSIRAARASMPEGVAVDDYGVQHNLYKCSDQKTIDSICALMKDRTILIADGHHRYETALNYYRDHNDPSYAYVMMTLVSMADPGLVIRPFHRLIRKGGAGLNLSKLEQYFDSIDRGSFTIDTVYSFMDSGSDQMLFADSFTKKIYGLVLNKGGEALLASIMPERSTAWKHLDVSEINAIIINTIMELPLDGHVLHDMIDYMNDPVAALSKLNDSASYFGGFFIRPMSINTVRDVVAGGERMPQKSTNFFPKLFSGLVFNKLGQS